MRLPVMSLARTGAVVLAAFAGQQLVASDAKRPYEMVWAGRTEDAHAPIAALTDASDWIVETTHAVARMETATDRLLFGDGVCRLIYRADGSGLEPKVVVRPKSPIAIFGPFDTVSCWVYGNNYMAYPDPTTPSVSIALSFKDAQNRAFDVPLLYVQHMEWFMAQRRLTPEQIERVRSGATLTGITVIGGTNVEDRSIDLNSLCVFRDALKSLSFAARAKRPNRVFPDADVGLNTGVGELPFPNAALGAVPPVCERKQLEFRLPSHAGDWDDLAFRWDGGAWQTIAAGGGVWFATASGNGSDLVRRSGAEVVAVTNGVSPLDVTIREGAIETRFRHLSQSLVVDVAVDSDEVGEVRFGYWRQPPRSQLVAVPYYSYRSGFNNRPVVVRAEVSGLSLFLGETVDWTQSNASELFADGAVGWDGSLAANGGARYRVKTDGNRNRCFERFVFSVSDRFEDVLPNIPNPASPWKNVAGTGVWRSYGASDRTWDAYYWRGVRARGLRHLIVTDHETSWRDGNESFTFRTDAAPLKGGDRGMYDYTRIMIDELGYRYGPYNNFTDLSPVNAYWDADRVSRSADGQLQQSWERCYAPKPTYAVEACEQLAPVLQGKFRFNAAYCDVHSCVAPWSRTDYDARVPGAGTFSETFYSYGEIMLLQKKAWNGPVASEGGCHFMYAGLTDANYAQDQDYSPAFRPWLVDFDLRRLHPLCCNFGMGDISMFYPGTSASADVDERVDRFLAATVAFGHPGAMVPYLGDGIEDRSYFMIQALAARYTQANVAEIGYVDASGRRKSVSQALADGTIKRSQVVVTYDDGTFVASNGSKTEPMRVTNDLWLPPNGYCGWSSDGMVFVYSGLVDGRRVDYSLSPEYVYMDGRGREISFPGGTATNARILLREDHAGEWPVAGVASFAARSAPDAIPPESAETAGLPDVPECFCVRMQLRGKEFEPINPVSGAQAESGARTCGGVSKAGFVTHPPYVGGVGRVCIRYLVDLPDRPVKFTASVGKGDGSGAGDGIYYSIEVEGEDGRSRVAGSAVVKTIGWKGISANLAAWAGQRVKLTLVTDCGPNDDTACDWGCWGDLRFVWLSDAVSTYEELCSVVATAQDGATIVVDADMEYDARLPVEGRKVTIRSQNGAAHVIKRASGYAGDILFVPTSAPQTQVTFEDIVIDGRSVEKCANRPIIWLAGTLTFGSGAFLRNFRLGSVDGSLYVGGNGGDVLGRLVFREGAAITGCETDGCGAGVYLTDGATVEMTGGEIGGCVTHSLLGGAVYIASGNFWMKGGEISHNTSDSGVGGVFVAYGYFRPTGTASVLDNVGSVANDVYLGGGYLAVPTGPDDPVCRARLTLKTVSEPVLGAPTYYDGGLMLWCTRNCPSDGLAGFVCEDFPEYHLDATTLVDGEYPRWLADNYLEIADRGVYGSLGRIFGQVKDEDVILLHGEINVSETIDVKDGMRLTLKGKGRLKRLTEKPVFRLQNASMRFEDIVLDGNRSVVSPNAVDPMFMVSEGGTVYLGSGAIIENAASAYNVKYWSTQPTLFRIWGSGARLVMEDGAVIRNCDMSDGGYGLAVRIGDGNAYDPKPTFVMQGGAISNNVITGATDTGNGGIVYVYNGLFQMSGGMITGNSCPDAPSGVNVYNGTAELSGTAHIENNLPSSYPDLYLRNDSSVSARLVGDFKGRIGVSSCGGWSDSETGIVGTPGETTGACRIFNAVDSGYGYAYGALSAYLYTTGKIYLYPASSRIDGIGCPAWHADGRDYVEEDVSLLVPSTVILGGEGGLTLPHTFEGVAARTLSGTLDVSLDSSFAADRPIPRVEILRSVGGPFLGLWQFAFPKVKGCHWTVEKVANGNGSESYFLECLPRGMAVIVR